MCNSDFHDRVAQLCFETFQAVPKKGKPKENEWTILSCIVLEDEGQFEVVALGTGTKCIGHDNMSKDGDILNDSHAEVICRRAFLRYIYENISQTENKLFTFDAKKQKFIIKSSIKFHFFSTHVPCGDAAIFAKQDIEEFGDLIVNEGNKSQGSKSDQESAKRKKCSDSHGDNKRTKTDENTGDIFRTGAKCLASDSNQDLRLEGVNFHFTGVVRTKPGRGVPTLSVSCSDKLAKWCHLGIQGALLSVLLEQPIYIRSFTISGDTPYNEEAIRRALFNRLGSLDFDYPYHQCDIILGQANSSFPHRKLQNRSPCPSAIVWLKGENLNRQIEVAVEGRRQGVTKKQLKLAGTLKISKVELFKYFLNLIEQRQIKLEGFDNLNKITYKQAKMYSHNYQKCWSIVRKKFKMWPVKDNSLMDFCISCE